MATMTTSQTSRTSRRKKDGGLPAGKLTFVLTGNLTADCSFEWQAATACLQCARPLLVQRGGTYAVLKAGTEVVGVCCPDCLTPESRQLLESMRGEAAR